MGYFSASSFPMPMACDPWPGKRNARGAFVRGIVVIVNRAGKFEAGNVAELGFYNRATVETLLATSSIPLRAELAARIPINVLSISELMGCSANSAATRIAFLIALAFDDPWVMKQTPFTPSRGAPPYSVWSRRFLKSANALRESMYPTWRVIVAFSDSFRVERTRLATPSEIFSAT